MEKINLILQGMISAGIWGAVGVDVNGNLYHTDKGEYYDVLRFIDEDDKSNWKYIIAVATGVGHMIALKVDGTVVIESTSFPYYCSSTCEVSNWKDIMAVSAGSDHVLGLKTDGTVLAIGNNKYQQCEVSDWKDIVSISAGDDYSVALTKDGKVLATGEKQCEVSDWKDIVAISAGGKDAIFSGDYDNIVGLRKDGTVLGTGKIQHNLESWKNIVMISVGAKHIVGLKADGTVVAIGNNEYKQCEVSDWTDIVAISASEEHTIGLRKDGTVIATNSEKCINQYDDISNWKLFDSVDDICQKREEIYLLYKFNIQKAKRKLEEEKRNLENQLVEENTFFSLLKNRKVRLKINKVNQELEKYCD